MQEPNHNLNPNFTTPTAFANGGTLFKRSKPLPLPLDVPQGHVAFRLLCHASRIGGVIGKGGSIIKQLQQETSSKIRIEDSLPNSDDHRVIVIVASSAIVKKINLNAIQQRQLQVEEVDFNGEEVEVSAAQEAVVRVFERVIEVAAETDGIVMAAGELASCRLLAAASQVGSVIGKGGKVIEKIRKDTGCKIKVLTNEKLPSCASHGDEMVEIEGDILAVKKALLAVTRCLQDCPPAVDRARMPGNRQFETVPQQTLPDLRVDLPPQTSSLRQPMAASSSNFALGGRAFSVEADRIPMMDSRTPQQEVVFKILCRNDKVGGVIGKGGSIVRALQAETGASISVGPPIDECDERLITIAAIENLESRQSAAQNAVILVFSRLVDAGPEKVLDAGLKRSTIYVRLVVPSNQVGCLLGKGGTIISEMRKISGTGIRIIGGDQVPNCASVSDEVVQITGEFANVEDALYIVTGRLRDNLSPTKLPSSFKTDGSPYGRIKDPPQLGFHPSDSVSQTLNQHNKLTQSMDSLGLSHSKDRPSSPRLWTSQILRGVNQRSLVDGRGLTSVKGGIELGSGSRSAIVTNTTVEIVVPENVIGSVYGENGSNLTRLRQISGAKVVVHEPRPGTTDRIVFISGSPDETQAAQSLLQAFILQDHHNK